MLALAKYSIGKSVLRMIHVDLPGNTIIPPLGEVSGYAISCSGQRYQHFPVARVNSIS
jgi:hypothetical protein